MTRSQAEAGGTVNPTGYGQEGKTSQRFMRVCARYLES